MDINDRVSKLERQNRWLKGGVIACVGVVCVAVIMGADKRDKDYGPFKSVTAQRFVVVDSEGKERGTLGIDGGSQSGTILNLWSASGEFISSMQADDKGFRLVGYSEKTETGITLKTTSSEADFVLRQDSTPRLQAGTGGEMSLIIGDTKGIPRFRFGIMQDANPEFNNKAVLAIQPKPGGEQVFLP